MLLQTFEPHPHLAPLLMHIMVLKLDGCESRLPVALSPNLVLFVRGGINAVEVDGTLVHYPRFTLSGPYMVPRHSIAEPGTLAISVMFRPGLLQDGFGISAADINARFLLVSDIVGVSKVHQLFSDLEEERPISEYVRLFQEFLLSTLDLNHKKSFGAAFLAAHQKMFLPLIDVAQYFGIGERQLERRVRKVFGVSLRDVRRISRFGLILPRLLGRSVARGELTHIAQEAGYYDQAHMHREFIEMSGLAPLQLLQKIASDDPAYWIYRITPADYEKLFISVD